MAEAQRYVFTFKELAEALVKQQDIHAGLWGAYVEFGIGAANIQDIANSGNILPAAIVPIKSIGIQIFLEENNLTVDAAQVNPLQKTKKSAT